MLRVVIPGNVSMMFRNIIPIAMFDFLGNQRGYDATLVFTFDEQTQALYQELAFDQIEDIGYSQH